jgi:hypothetical protein
MSDQSHRAHSNRDYYSRLGPARQLREAERALITKLVRNTSYENDVMEQLCDGVVHDMPDGGMGSIKFQNRSSSEPFYGKQIAEGAFRDRDGTAVSVTLSLDGSGSLFEFDVFKADGSALISYPALEDFEIVERHEKRGYE